MSGRYAYVDESLRPGRYLTCLVTVEPARAGPTRARLQSLLLPRQRRLHFQRESLERRKQLLAALVELDVRVEVFSCWHEQGRSERRARELCLAAIVERLQASDGAVTLYVEGREGRDHDDRRVIDRVRRREPALDYHHILPAEDPLIWLPDCFGWPAGAGGHWLDRVRPVVGAVREVG